MPKSYQVGRGKGARGASGGQDLKEGLGSHESPPEGDAFYESVEIAHGWCLRGGGGDRVNIGTCMRGVKGVGCSTGWENTKALGGNELHTLSTALKCL